MNLCGVLSSNCCSARVITRQLMAL
ncbi:hypothetical protein Gohar_010797 [Gossypium harknessii]|uniref:Uncharacterized protein n=1 Tax=Gossypium harknessii TaxID=34285 RepID=A0A7J9GS04_9ROSI|nr:hypothetical protein [Gossypium harknessii]